MYSCTAVVEHRCKSSVGANGKDDCSKHEWFTSQEECTNSNKKGCLWVKDAHQIGVVNFTPDHHEGIATVAVRVGEGTPSATQQIVFARVSPILVLVLSAAFTALLFWTVTEIVRRGLPNKKVGDRTLVPGRFLFSIPDEQLQPVEVAASSFLDCIHIWLFVRAVFDLAGAMAVCAPGRAEHDRGIAWHQRRNDHRVGRSERNAGRKRRRIAEPDRGRLDMQRGCSGSGAVPVFRMDDRRLCGIRWPATCTGSIDSEQIPGNTLRSAHAYGCKCSRIIPEAR